MQKALQFYKNGEYERALEAFTELRHKIKKSAAVHCFFGNLYLLLNQPAPAQQEFFAALNYDQTSSHALVALSYLALREGEFNMAIESLATALRLGACEQEYQNFLTKLILAVENREDRNDWLT
jgi:predicted Zn-dependent protease